MWGSPPFDLLGGWGLWVPDSHPGVSPKRSTLLGPKLMKTGTLDHRRRGRLFYCLVSLVLALGISRQAAAANTTTVQDVIYRADGTPAAGTLVISWR